MSLNNVISPVDDNPNAPFPFGFTEKAGESAEENLDWLNGTVDLVRVFEGPWENRIDFVLALFAGVVSVRGQQVVFNPAFYPEYEGAFAHKVNIKGKLKADRNVVTNLIKYDIAHIVVNYTAAKFNFPNQKDKNDTSQPKIDFVEESITSSTEGLPLKINKSIYTGPTQTSPAKDGDPVVGFGASNEPLYPFYDPNTTDLEDLFTLKEFTYNKILVILNYKLKIPVILEPNWLGIQSCLGKVNRQPFTMPSGLTADIETLRYDGISAITKRELSQGTLAWEFEHNFAYYSPGWNTRPNASFNDVPNAEGFAKDAIVVKDMPIIPKLYYSAVFQNIFIGSFIGEVIQ